MSPLRRFVALDNLANLVGCANVKAADWTLPPEEHEYENGSTALGSDDEVPVKMAVLLRRDKDSMSRDMPVMGKAALLSRRSKGRSVELRVQELVEDRFQERMAWLHQRILERQLKAKDRMNKSTLGSMENDHSSCKPPSPPVAESEEDHHETDDGDNYETEEGDHYETEDDHHHVRRPYIKHLDVRVNFNVNGPLTINVCKPRSSVARRARAAKQRKAPEAVTAQGQVSATDKPKKNKKDKAASKLNSLLKMLSSWTCTK